MKMRQTSERGTDVKIDRGSLGGRNRSRVKSMGRSWDMKEEKMVERQVGL